jgi:hypothetical protein
MLLTGANRSAAITCKGGLWRRGARLGRHQTIRLYERSAFPVEVLAAYREKWNQQLKSK